jgi:hypothetical protein
MVLENRSTVVAFVLDAALVAEVNDVVLLDVVTVPAILVAAAVVAVMF